MNGMRRMLLWLGIGVLAVAACAPVASPPEDPWSILRQADGSVVWLEEYRFEPPPSPWEPLDLNETDLSLAFYKPCVSAGRLCESSLGYAEEPFGSSQDLQVRARQYFRRHLWAARVKFPEPALQTATVAGREAVVVMAEAREQVSGQKVLTKAIFMHRGERVVAMFMNQWRAGDNPFDLAEFAILDRFAASFSFLRPSFYEKL